MNTPTLSLLVLFGLAFVYPTHSIEILGSIQCKSFSYTYTPDIGCHRMYQINKNWHEARKICQEDEADLTIINTDKEAEIILNMMKNHEWASLKDNVIYAWVGVQHKNGSWTTINGEHFDGTYYYQWHEYNNITVKGYSYNKCLVMALDKRTRTQGLEIKNCDEKLCQYQYSFICEKKSWF